MFYEQGSVSHSACRKPVKIKLRYYSPLFFGGWLCHGLTSSLLSSSNRWAVSRSLVAKLKQRLTRSTLFLLYLYSILYLTESALYITC